MKKLKRLVCLIVVSVFLFAVVPGTVLSAGNCQRCNGMGALFLTSSEYYKNPSQYTLRGIDSSLGTTYYVVNCPSCNGTGQAGSSWTSYIVTFNANGGSCAIQSKNTSRNGTIDGLPVATRTGYVFDGWYTLPSGGEKITGTTVFYRNTTVYAHWRVGGSTQSTYTILLVTNGGIIGSLSGNISLTTGTNGRLSSLPTPTRTGYTFDGWYTSSTGGTKVTTSYVFTGNATIHAHWTYIGVSQTTYTVYYNANGGNVSTSSARTGTNGRLSSLPIPTRTGYTFDGWYTSSTGGTKVTTAYVFTGNATIYAHWVEKTDGGFLDITESDFYYQAVIWAVERGIANGTEKNRFSPYGGCTRGAVVTFLWRAEGSPEPQGSSNPFVDVKSGAYYYKAVLWSVEKGITKGTATTHFSPDETCTRGQIVTFLWRSEKEPKPTGTGNPFADVNTSDYFFNAVLWAVSKGITKGTDATHFSPSDTCTRGQVVTFLYRDKTQ